ncbi:hypothetical protein JQ543_30655 [Bradyrhizobium diazoefficiens]|nr:hypothetical protein [Bradyrhizobium diazoefficiens]MBR0852132.1 hypothetical protein [Bradyrhizobium diazoefficiens]
MALQVGIFRPSVHDAENLESLREYVREAAEVLKSAVPDTFLGRKTQEPFPRETNPTNVKTG